MPLPLAPVAGFALRAAAMSLTAYAIMRARDGLARDQRAEDALDALPEGAKIARDGEAVRGAVHWKRTFRVGHGGPGVMVDFSGLARLRVQRVG